MTTPLVIIGGGEHARVVAEAARSAGLSLAGFVDPAARGDTVERLELPHLGDDDSLTSAVAILGVGAAAATRRGIVERLSQRVASWAVVVHASAWVSPTAHIGEGTIIMAGVTINTGAQVGRHCIINTGVVVEHDVVLGDYATLAPGVTVGGGTVIGMNAYIGLGASVRDHVRIGAGAFVGMGSIVISDVPDGARVRAPVAAIEAPKGP